MDPKRRDRDSLLLRRSERLVIAATRGVQVVVIPS